MDDLDLYDLRSRARSAPGELSADDKNRLVAARLGVDWAPVVESYSEPVSNEISEPAPVASGTANVVTEVVLPGSYYDPDDHLGPNQGGTRFMRRITRTAKRKDQNPLQHERMLQIAAYLWDRNPLAARVIKRAVNYVLGEGVRVVARGDDEKERENVQAVIDEFWYDHRNRLDKKLLKWAISWRTYGELCLRVDVNPVSGKVRLAFVSPELIMDVTPEKLDIEQIDVVKLSRGSGDTEGEKIKAFRVLEKPEEIEAWYTSGAQNADKKKPRAIDRAHGDIVYFATNVLPDMVRGRSDLMAIADLIDGYDQFIWNRMERQALLLAFVWSVTLTGMTDQQITEWMNSHAGVPKPGSVQAHNEKVKWEAVAPSLGSGEAQMESDLMLNFIATSQGMPAMWFGENNDPNRANGENLTGPTLKDMTGLQNEFKEVLHTLITLVLDQAVVAGVLETSLDTRKAFEVQMPDLSIRDMLATANTISTLANAAALARQYELLDLTTSQELMVLALAPTGVKIGIKELRERIEKDQAKLKADQAEQDAAYGADQGQQGGWGEQAQQGQQPGVPPISISYKTSSSSTGPPNGSPDGSERRRI